MKFKKMIYDQPSSTESSKTKPAKAVIGGSTDLYGACSIETFSSASGLSLTHEDAKGFLDWVTGYPNISANFWSSDAGVQVWEYEETYDNWQDTYGMDAVRTFYHSGHGNMDSKGVFQAPMGAPWDNRDWAYSDRMAFSNEELRYLFWSTCYSLRVSGPDSPIRTWWDPNKGNLKMIFGYETTSIDAATYGRYFGEEWKKNKSFTRSFLDASWRISHNQVPVVMASGANQAEAVNRLNNERLFNGGACPKGWYQWQWIGALPARAMAEPLKLPKSMNALILDKNQFDEERMSKIAAHLGCTKTQAETILFDRFGNRLIDSKKMRMNVNEEGALNIYFGEANVENKQAIEEQKAISIAKSMVKELGFDKNIELALGNIRNRLTCGGTEKGSGQLDQPSNVETIVQFRQTHNGVKSINSDHGLITVCVDNDGKITNLYNSTKLILGETDKPAAVIKAPKSSVNHPKAVEETFEAKINKIKLAATPILKNGKLKAMGDDKTLHEYIGYDFSENLGVIVHQKDVEITFPDDFKKRYKLRVPVMG